MGNSVSFGKGSGKAKADQLSSDRLDFPTPQSCFEVGGPSSPPEEIKHVLPESVVLVTRDEVITDPAPVEPPRVEEVQEAESEDEQEEELSRYELGVYNDDFSLEPVSDEAMDEEEDEEMLEVDPVASAVMAEFDPEDEDPSEDGPEGAEPLVDPEEVEPMEDDSEEENFETDRDEQLSESDRGYDSEPQSAPTPAYPLLTYADWDFLYQHGIGKGESTVSEACLLCPPRWRSRAPGARPMRAPCQCELFALVEEQQRMIQDLAITRRRTEMGSRSPEPCDPGPSRRRSPSPEQDDEPSPKRPCMDSRIYRRRFGAP